MDTRERILQAASLQLDQAGYERFRVEELAALLGLSKRTIYNYFGSKLELFTAVREYEFDGLVTNLERIASEADRPLFERVAGLMQVTYNFLSSRLRGARGEASAYFAPDAVPQRRGPFSGALLSRRRSGSPWAQFTTRSGEVLGALLDEGRREGLVRPQVKAGDILITMQAAVHRLDEFCTLPEVGESPEEILRIILRFVHTAVLTDAGLVRLQEYTDRGVRDGAE